MTLYRNTLNLYITNYLAGGRQLQLDASVEQIKLQVGRSMSLAAYARNGHGFGIKVHICGHTFFEQCPWNGRGNGSATITYNSFGVWLQY